MKSNYLPRMRGCLLLLVLTITAGILPHKVLAQQKQGTITGYVFGLNSEPLNGATVSLTGTNVSTFTASDGSFSISHLPGTYTITVSNTSYTTVTQSVTIRDDQTTNLSFTLQAAAANNLDEVIVVGYGTQKKVNLTGAVDQISSKDIENRVVPNLSQGLQGIIPNLNLVPADGKPITSPAYNIRGTTSIGQGGNALVLIDGVEGDPSRINPNDIANISVLKDAASAAIYGARGAFGVVLITTKNPRKGKSSINYTFNYSLKQPTAVPKFVTDGLVFSKMFNDGWSAWNNYSQFPQNVNKTVRFSQEYLQEFEKRRKEGNGEEVDVNAAGEYVYYANTDWMDLLYKKQTNAMEHNLTFSGGSDKADYMLTGRIYKQAGIFRYNSDDYSTYNVRAKGSVNLFPWLTVYSNSDFSSMKYHNPLNVGEGGGIWRNIADEGHTNVPLTNPDGTLTYSAAYTVGDFYYGKNGIDMDRRVIRTTAGFTTKFLSDQLRLKGDYTFQNTDNDQTRVRVPVPYSRKPGVIEYVGTNYNDLQNLDRTSRYIATNTYLEFEPKWSDEHYLKALVGYNYEQNTFKQLEVVRNGLIFPDATDMDLALGQSITTNGGWDEWAILGGFYRLNYIFKDKYLVETNGRYDGSSKFPENQRFAFFPSISLGWRVSNENFWTNISDVINDFKIRGSYGALGNGNINSYAFMELFNISQSEEVLNGIRPQRTSQPGVIPAGLTWETSQSTNLGFDIAFLKNRLTINFDAYRRKTKDMFTVGVTQPAVFGIGVPRGNYADLTTKGWETVVEWRNGSKIGGKPFNYSTRFNIGDYTATIDKFNNADKRLSDYYVGQKVGEIWGYVTERYFTDADFDKNPGGTLTLKEGIAKQIAVRSSTSGQILPGDIKFADLNGDGFIDNGTNTVNNPGDRKVIGNSLPRFSYGLNANVEWNNLFISAFFQGVGKQDWYPGSEAGIFWGQYNRPYNKVPEFQLGKIWSEENPHAYFPRYRGYLAQNGSAALTQNQTKYLQNIAYLRLKNLQLGYNLPSSLIGKIGATNARVYLTGENLWTTSPLYKLTKDLDVENAAAGSDNVLTNGGNGRGNNYPILKSYTVGVSINF